MKLRRVFVRVRHSVT